MAGNSDPTKDLEFQKVIRHFVTTPHRPHESLAEENKRAVATKASRTKKANPFKKRGLSKKKDE
jgi:hypothetical protein